MKRPGSRAAAGWCPSAVERPSPGKYASPHALLGKDGARSAVGVILRRGFAEEEVGGEAVGALVWRPWAFDAIEVEPAGEGLN